MTGKEILSYVSSLYQLGELSKDEKNEIVEITKANMRTGDFSQIIQKLNQLEFKSETAKRLKNDLISYICEN